MINKTKAENWKHGDTVKYVGRPLNCYDYDISTNDVFIIGEVMVDGGRVWVLPKGYRGNAFNAANFVFVK